MNLPIYLDNHATTPLDPRVLEAMMPFLTTDFGNAASGSHAYGWKAKEAVEQARTQVATLIGAHPQEIVFTSGATESTNAALKGAAKGHKKKRHILTSKIEHNSVLDTCHRLEHHGFEVTFLSPGCDGIVSIESVIDAMTPETLLASFMLANNEIGTINPIREMVLAAKAKDVFFHCDLVQGIGRVPVNVEDLQVDMASLSAHKIYGPKGVGALYVRQKIRGELEPLLHGGGHENGLRSGTLNVPGIVGFGVACELMHDEMISENQRIFALRESLREQLQKALPGCRVNGSLENRLSGNLNVSFSGIDGEDLLLAIQNKLAVSAGSACSSASHRPSHVLSCLGLEPQASLRFGIGRFNTADEINIAAKLVIQAVKKLSTGLCSIN